MVVGGLFTDDATNEFLKAVPVVTEYRPDCHMIRYFFAPKFLRWWGFLIRAKSVAIKMYITDLDIAFFIVSESRGQLVVRE